MKISEIAPGEKRTVQTSKFDKIWNKLIVPNCSEILKIYTSSNKLLYRGMKCAGPIFRGSSRQDRKPRDSYLFLNDLFDVGLKRLGMTALRSNSTFVISNENIALNFGDFVYIIFPLDGFEYTWTKHTDISLGNRQTFKNHWLNANISEIINQAWQNEPHYLNSYESENWLLDNDLIDPTQSLEENMHNINNLLAKHNISAIRPIDLIHIESFKDFFEPRNTGLLDMLKNSSKSNPKETLIKGSYYAFDTGFFNNKIIRKLQQYGNSIT